MQTKRWQDCVMLVVGVWLFLSPFWMAAYASSSNAAAWNAYVMGALVVAFSWAALVNRRMWEEWVNLAVGVWLIIAPFVLAFYAGQVGAGWNQIIAGLIVAIDAAWVIAGLHHGRSPHDH